MKRIIAPRRACALSVTLALISIMSYLPHPPATIARAQDVTPQGELTELAIDNGVGRCVLGAPAFLKGMPGFGWVNKLTPTAYPATLRSVTIGFSRTGPLGREVRPDSLYRIVVFADPEMDGPNSNQAPDAAFIGRVRGMDQIMTFNLVTPLTIQSGSLVVGVIDEFGIADFPALLDVPGKSNPQGSESFITTNAGGSWQKLSDIALQGETPCDKAGSFLIRATVETGAIQPLTVTTIKDPQAVEPWGVTANMGEVFVTNYVSDNMTVIDTATNDFENLALGDGPGGTPDGPFGVVSGDIIFGDAISTRTFVTLFGSNTIPSKEFPIDYSSVGPGRVVILSRQANGSYSQSGVISVGKGPRFPALVNITNSTRTKLYVPCGGANRVDVIDAASGSKIAEIPVGLDPSSCTASINNAKVYVTNFGDGTVSVIDTKTDQKIKDIPAPSLPAFIGTPPFPPVPVTATNPWQGSISQTSGNLFVTYWGTLATNGPNGGLVEFDTCKDEFVRAIIDDTTRGARAGTAGASGIQAPGGPLVRNPETGATPGAGGGGGGPFGISSSRAGLASMVFTNDALGKAAIFDPRIGQVVSSPAIGGTMCAKPRGVDCAIDPRPVPPNAVPDRIAYVACGQPENAVMVFRVPSLPENIAGQPTIESVSVGSNIKIKGKGFVLDTRLEVIAFDSVACLTFNQAPKFKKKVTLLLQKGGLSDGSKPNAHGGIIIRLIMPDGTIRLLRT
jgi:YVTN family beta-propeller protein